MTSEKQKKINKMTKNNKMYKVAIDFSPYNKQFWYSDMIKTYCCELTPSYFCIEHIIGEPYTYKYKDKEVKVEHQNVYSGYFNTKNVTLISEV